MNCDESRIYLAAYLDEELGVGESLRIQKHLAGCVTCREVQEDQLALRSALLDADLYAQPSADLSTRIQAAVRHAARDEERSQRPSWFGWLRMGSLSWIPAAAALVMVTTSASLLVMNRSHPSGEQLVANAVLNGHIRSLQPGHLIDVPSSDRHTVKPWFQGKLDFSPPVPDLAERGWPLVGGRLDYIDGQAVAVLVYQRRLHHINVFLWPNRGPADTAIQQEDAQGYQILHWSGADTTYWVVSDLNNAELLELARALREQ